MPGAVDAVESFNSLSFESTAVRLSTVRAEENPTLDSDLLVLKSTYGRTSLTTEETAATIGVSPGTARRDSIAAAPGLRVELSREAKA